MPTPSLKKAKENLDSARFLIGKECFDSSIHCAYYGCLQMVKQVLYDKVGERELENAVKGKNSHLYLVETISALFSEKTNVPDWTLKNRIDKLKKLRVKADYGKRHFLEHDSTATLLEAENIVALLHSTFQTPAL